MTLWSAACGEKKRVTSSSKKVKHVVQIDEGVHVDRGVGGELLAQVQEASDVPEIAGPQGLEIAIEDVAASVEAIDGIDDEVGSGESLAPIGWDRCRGRGEDGVELVTADGGAAEATRRAAARDDLLDRRTRHRPWVRRRRE